MRLAWTSPARRFSRQSQVVSPFLVYLHHFSTFLGRQKHSQAMPSASICWPGTTRHWCSRPSAPGAILVTRRRLAVGPSMLPRFLGLAVYLCMLPLLLSLTQAQVTLSSQLPMVHSVAHCWAFRFSQSSQSMALPW